MKGIHPDHRERVLKGFDKAAHFGTEFWQEEYQYKASDGTYRDILHSRYFVRDEQKQIRSCVGAVQDLTKHRQVERKFHEQQLQMKNELSRTIIKTEEKERNRWAVELRFAARIAANPLPRSALCRGSGRGKVASGRRPKVYAVHSVAGKMTNLYT